jgi:hypothetical protein
MGDFVGALFSSIAELAVYVFGLILGRTFKLDPERAQEIGGFLVAIVFVSLLVTVTIIYS